MTEQKQAKFLRSVTLKGRRQKRAVLRVPVRIINRGSKAEVRRDGEGLDITEAMWLLFLSARATSSQPVYRLDTSAAITRTAAFKVLHVGVSGRRLDALQKFADDAGRCLITADASSSAWGSSGLGCQGSQAPK